MKIYRGKIYYLLPILFFPVVISLATILDGESPSLFLLLLPIPFLLLMLVSIGYKLEAGEGFVKNSFLNTALFKIYYSDVEAITYGGMTARIKGVRYLLLICNASLTLTAL